jgi:hypothetical protein
MINSFLLSMFLAAPHIAFAQEVILNDVVTEADAPKKKKTNKSQSLKIQELRVPVGQGAENVDKVLNEQGVIATKLDGSSQLSLQRKNPKLIKARRPFRVFGQWGPTRKSELTYSQENAELIFGLSSTKEDLEYLNTGELLYSAEDDQVSVTQRKAEHYFVEGKFLFSRSKIKGIFDQKEEDVFAGFLKNGTAKETAAEVYLTQDIKKWQLGAFSQTSQEEFLSDSDLWSNSETGQLRYGAFVSFQDYLKIQGSRLKFKRSFSGEENLSDDQGQVFTQFQWATSSNPYVELKITESLDIQENRFNDYSALTHALFLSSSTQYDFGFNGTLKLFENIPTQEMLLGDGKLIVENPELENEEGTRFSVGPWIKPLESNWSLTSHYFREQTKASPIWISSTPSTVKADSLAGVWAEGVETSFQLKKNWFETNLKATFQRALNDSEVLWQKGNDVPDRPRRTYSVGVRGYWRTYFLQTDWRSVSSIPLSLDNEVSYPAEQNLSVQFGSQGKDLGYRFVGENLLSTQKRALEFERAAGVSLLKPYTPQQRFYFQIEASL